MSKKKYVEGYFRDEGKYIFSSVGESFVTELDPGCYEIKSNMQYGIYLNSVNFESDTIVDLPTSEYDLLIRTIEDFLKPETKARYEQTGSIYRLSSLIYGKPGVGKTAIINRTMKKVIAEGGIVLFNPNLGQLYEIIDIVSRTNPDKTLMIVLEEFETTAEINEETLLHILDGEKTKNNMIVLATTNFVDKVPPRMIRPGRMNYLVEVGLPTREARRVFLEIKHPDKSKIEQLLNVSDGFNIDELKQLMVQTYCLNQDVNEVVSRIIGNKTIIGRDKREKINLFKDGNSYGIAPGSIFEQVIDNTIKTDNPYEDSEYYDDEERG